MIEQELTPPEDKKNRYEWSKCDNCEKSFIDEDLHYVPHKMICDKCLEQEFNNNN